MFWENEKSSQGSSYTMNAVAEFIKNIYELWILDKIGYAVIFTQIEEDAYLTGDYSKL